MTQLLCDVLIFGAGIIGSTLAISLAKSGLNVIIIDQKFPIKIKKTIQSVPYIRTSAINYTSVKFLRKIKIWEKIPSCYCTPYHTLETWEWESSKVTFHSKILNLPMMGYTVENNRLQFALWNDFSNYSTLRLYCPCTLVSMSYHRSFWKCIFDNDVTVKSHLLIGADGLKSHIRERLGIKNTVWQYTQHCLLLIIKIEKNSHGKIWQVFTPWGPIGFLPLYNNWGSLMWYDSFEKISFLKKLPISILEKEIEKKFKKKLGYIKLYNLAIIPLTYQRSHRYIHLNSALVGDAACTIHPLAGQGINLGLRDVINLSDLIINTYNCHTCIELSDILRIYEKNRQYDSWCMQTGINFLYAVFHNNFLPLKIARNSIFIAIENFPYLKKQILKYALGIKYPHFF